MNVLFTSRLLPIFLLSCCCPVFHSVYAQCGGGPCDATRYTRGSAWNPNGTINDSPQANGGIIRCGNSAETQSNIQPNSCYDPAVFTITTMNCVNPGNGQPVSLTGPLPGQQVKWLNFDVRAFSSSFDFQMVSNDNLGWALYRSVTSTTPPPNGALSGDCNLLVFNSCGVDFNGWSSVPFQNLDFPYPSNFYLAVWDMDYIPGNQNSGKFNFNFKARYSCGEQVCQYQIGEKSLQCNGDTYTVTVPVSGNNVTLTAADPLANSITYSPNPLTLTNPGANNPVTTGTITAVYDAGEPYNLTITPTSNLSGCSPTTVAGFSPPGCCNIGISCPPDTAVTCAGDVPAADTTAVTITGCPVDTNGCAAFCTYTQGAYGNAGGVHSNGLNTTQTLDSLLKSGPIVIGGGPNNCGFQVTTSACILGILPAGGPSQPLPEHFTLNCNESVDNTLVGQLVTLILNVRYNLRFNDGLDLGDADLSCVLTPSQLSGLGLSPSASVDDLIDLANEFLAATCNDTTYANGFGGQITAAAGAVNEYWDECPTGSNSAPPVVTVSDSITGQTCGNSFTIIRTYQATNGTGNTATCTQVIAVNDTIAPTLTCPAPVTVSCLENVPYPDSTLVTATDNCDSTLAVTFVSDSASGQACPIVITRTYQASDSCGNTATCTQLITVNDVTPPTVNCPPSLTVTCPGDVPDPDSTLVIATDNCLGIVTVTFVSDVVTNQGATITRTYLATDACGNTATCSQAITVQNPGGTPGITCPDDLTVTCAGDVPTPNPDLVGIDTCFGGSPVVTFAGDSIINQTCPNSFTLLRTYEATNGLGDMVSCLQVITVNDTIAPVLANVPANITVQCNAVPPLDTLSASDNCETSVIVTVEATTTPGACPDAYTIVRVWTATDSCGNSATASQTVTVVDTQAPVLIGVPANVTVQCDSVPAQINLTAIDNCDTLVVVTPVSGITPGNCPNTYIIQWTWTATDNCGNTATATQTVTVTDTIAPVITCPASITVNCPIDVPASDSTTVTATDNCLGIVTVTFVSDVVTNQGATITRTYLATDACGNTATCTQVISIFNPGGSPGITCPDDLTVACADDVPAPNPDQVGIDTCFGATPMVNFTGDSIVNQTCVHSYTILRTYQATNALGDTATCTQIITVNDSIAPTITCPTAVTVSCLNDLPGIDSSIVATDNCDSTVTVTFVNDSTIGQGCPLTVIRTYLATDDCGNTATCAQMITVNDTLPPLIIVCPPPITVNCPNDVPVPDSTLVTAFDLCDTSVTITFLNDLVINQGNVTLIIRTYVATDDCGNTATHVHLITVQNQNGTPNITCPDPLTVLCTFDVPAPDPDAIIVVDTCSNDTLDVVFRGDSVSNQTCPSYFTITRTYQAFNGAGDSVSCTQIITVNDSIAPTITCPPALTVNCVNDVPAPDTTLVTVTDDCGDTAVVVIFLNDIVSGQGCPQTITRTYQATDGCGNTATCMQVITVNDTIAPVITCPVGLTVSCLDDVPAADSTLVTATDNCDSTVTVTFVSDSTIGQGCPQTVIRTYEATDDCGNTATCTQVITVNDTIAPVITCPVGLTVSCLDDVPAADSTLVTATDNCDSTVTVTFLSDSTIGQGCPQTVIRTYEATDDCGNTATCTQVITVNDTIAPVITCPVGLTVSCLDDVPAADSTLVTATDNCDSTVTVTFVSDSTIGQGCPQTVIRTYEATDDCGNTATCTQVITVNDTIAPVITCPAPITVNCPIDVPAPDSTIVTATDNCLGIVTITFVSDTVINQGAAVIRTYQAADACGNTATCTQVITVTVTGNTPIVCPDDITVQCSGDVPAPTPDIVGLDTCFGGIPEVVFLSDSIINRTCPNSYTILRTYQATNGIGDTVTCTQTITVNDTIAPSITCPAAVTVTCQADVPAPDSSLVSATDNCDSTVTVTFVSDSAGGQDCPLTIVRTYMATDSCGNTAICTQLITVNDTIAPTITCPPSVTISCLDGVPGPDSNLVTATDNCLGLVTVTLISDSTSDQGCPKVITRTYLATDACGNNATCTRQITVIDILPPYITGCPDPDTVNCLAQLPVPDTTLVTAIDLCDTSVTITYIGDQIIQQGNVTLVLRTYHATDDCGNFAVHAHLITVLGADDILGIVCPDPLTVQCSGDVPTPNPGIVSTDSCFNGTADIVFVNDAISDSFCLNGYTITRTYQATDSLGNTATCSQSITFNDTTPPSGICPTDITVSCIGNVPCGDTLSPAVQHLIQLVENAYTDNCGGAVTVTFLEASDLETCADPDGDSVFTFERVFYFQVADSCGNITLCDISYTGNCEAFCTYTQGAWGSAGGLHSNGLNTGETLDSLLLSGPIVVGDGTCGFEVSTSDCILGILPAGGPSVPLPQNFPLDCGETLNNTLAGQRITLELNIRYNQRFNDSLDLGEQELACVLDDGDIDSLGLDSLATVNDLIALADSFLAANCNGSVYPNGFGGGLTNVLTALNERWDECQQADPCTGTVFYHGGISSDAASLFEALQIFPNPTTSLVNVVFTSETAATVQFRILNTEGRLMHELKSDIKKGENRVQIDVSHLPAGLYLLNLVSEKGQVTERLVIMRM